MLEISVDPQVVTVEGTGRVLDAGSGLSLSLSAESLHDMPMEGRNFLNLAGAAPGVVGRGSLSDFDNFAPEKDFDFSANGRGSSGNIFLLDGLNVTGNIMSGVANLSPNPDSIQEYNVQTNTFTVEQGRANSLQVSMVTRGGTNFWHIPAPTSARRAIGRLLNGWEITTVTSLQSGTPFTVINRSPFDPILDAGGRVVGLQPDSGDYNADGYNYDFPNTPARNFTLSNSRRQFIDGVFTTGDFPLPTPGTQGNLKRNTFRNPGLLNVDAGLIKNNRALLFRENVNVQFRCEVFNLLNRVNLQAVDSNLGSGTFGRSTAAYSPRTMQLGLRVVF